MDAGIGSLGTLNDNSPAQVAKGAALLEYMGYAPPGGSGYASYGATAAAAMNSVAGRNPWLSIPPANAPDHVVDSGTLQNLAEAYDLLRGSSSVTTAQRTAMEAKLVDWTDARSSDLYMTTLSQKDSNWGTKTGPALVTAALAISDNSRRGRFSTKASAW